MLDGVLSFGRYFIGGIARADAAVRRGKTLPLLHFFAAEMLNLNFKELRGLSCACNFLIYQLLAGEVFQHDFAQQRRGLQIVFHQMASAERNDALHKRRPSLFLYRFVAINGEAYLVAGAQRVDLVACARSVKINPLRVDVIEIIDGDCVGIASSPLTASTPRRLACKSAFAAQRFSSFFFLRMTRNIFRCSNHHTVNFDGSSGCRRDSLRRAGL